LTSLSPRPWSSQECFNACQTCLLRQLRRVHRSLDTESVNTLVHAFFISRVDFCNSALTSALRKKVMDKLQHVQNAAARLLTGTRKYQRDLSRLMQDVRPVLAGYSSTSAVQACSDSPSLSSASSCKVPRRLLRASLRSSLSPASLPDVINCQFRRPQVCRSTFRIVHAFSVAERTVWHSLPDHMRDPAVDSEQFRRDLETYLFSGHSKH